MVIVGIVSGYEPDTVNLSVTPARGTRRTPIRPVVRRFPPVGHTGIPGPECLARSRLVVGSSQNNEERSDDLSVTNDQPTVEITEGNVTNLSLGDNREKDKLCRITSTPRPDV